MVATADVNATTAAVAVLKEGGNVIDAAIAATFVLSVTQPGMCGLGGGGHLLAGFANGQTLCLDFREQAPEAASRDMFATLPANASIVGWHAAATPGTVRGLGEAHRRAGFLPWRRLVEPAIELAGAGHPVSYLRSQMLATSSSLRRDPESCRILLRDGRCFEPGEILRQPELAETLSRIAANGADEFYRGETAQRLARAISEHRGAIRNSDLEAYTCADCTALMRHFRGCEVWTMPLSSAGGIGLLEILAILEGTSFAAEGPGSASFLHFLAEAMRRAFADRSGAIGDELLDPAHISRWRDSIHPDRATPSAGLGQAGPISIEPSCTTHLSVLDREGNAAALTFTLNGMYGSGVTVPGLGFLLNNNMDNFAVRPGMPNQYGVVQGEANAIAPGKRPMSSMAPTIVCRDGRTEAVMGTPGGPTIPTAVAQVLLYLIEFGWNPRDAVNAPRIHHQWLPDVLYLERGFAPEVTRGLESRGHRLEYKTSMNDFNAIVWRDGWLQGAADCRREGCANGI
jgi:gamma-glutamyltranspeptidase/glutathione hydrolase